VDKVRLPQVFLTPIRSDIVQFVHTNLRKNSRQAYGVARWAGHQTSAESWGTGRAVARIPRVPGGGTHRAGQGAFGNMCRGGRMFGPTRTWRRWHRKVLKGQKRYAVASALAASAIPALVTARGHKISEIAEIPLVVANEVLEGLGKTKKAAALLKKLNVDADIRKAKYSVVHRAGRGKMRNRPYKEKLGPMIVHNSPLASISPALRNLPGVEIVNVARLNLLRLAPGGHLGRFIIWTRGAFTQLDKHWGTKNRPSELKKGFILPRPILTNPDITRIITSDEIRSAVRPIRLITKHRHWVNPFRNPKRMAQLNPYAAPARAARRNQALANHERKVKLREAHKAAGKKEPKEPSAPGTGLTNLAKKWSTRFKKMLFA